MTLITRPRIDLCQQPRCIPEQCKMLLKLTANKSMSDKNDAKYALKIHSCKCLVRRVKLIDTTKIAFQTMIKQHHESFRYPIRHVKMKLQLLNSGFSNFEFDNMFLVMSLTA